MSLILPRFCLIRFCRNLAYDAADLAAIILKLMTLWCFLVPIVAVIMIDMPIIWFDLWIPRASVLTYRHWHGFVLNGWLWNLVIPLLSLVVTSDIRDPDKLLTFTVPVRLLICCADIFLMQYRVMIAARVRLVWWWRASS